MDNVTLTCGCGRQMREIGTAPKGTFGCGCGHRVVLLIADAPKCTGLSEADRQCGFRPVREATEAGLSLCQDHWDAYAAAVKVMLGMDPQVLYWDPPKNAAEWLADMRQRMDAASIRSEPNRNAVEAASVVYYVRIRDTIKIGTTVNLRSRLYSLVPDELLAIEPGGVRLERMRHQQFAAYRIRGERFHPSEELMSHIAMLREHYGEPEVTGRGR